MNESQTKHDFIDPALKEAGWGVVEGSRIRFFTVPFEDRGGTWQPRYYQENAITKALEAIAEEKII
jgi:type I restriction enzyme R subunit